MKDGHEARPQWGGRACPEVTPSGEREARGQRIRHGAANGVGRHSLRQGIIVPTKPRQRVRIMVENYQPPRPQLAASHDASRLRTKGPTTRDFGPPGHVMGAPAGWVVGPMGGDRRPAHAPVRNSVSPVDATPVWLRVSTGTRQLRGGTDLARAPFTSAWEIARACAFSCVYCRADNEHRRNPTS